MATSEPIFAALARTGGWLNLFNFKSFKKGLQDDDKAPEKPAEPVKTIDHNNATPTAARTDVGSKAV